MADLVLIAVTLGFVALCVAYISWCDHIIGPDDFGPDSTPSAATGTAVPAGAPAERPVEVTA
ncbi:MAG: hypothetical protein JWN99_2310 [Ilumatobacteraceae bacterium]|nr:hypothetical protein [Ilumatobacteraceae bacterium]